MTATTPRSSHVCIAASLLATLVVACGVEGEDTFARAAIARPAPDDAAMLGTAGAGPAPLAPGLPFVQQAPDAPAPPAAGAPLAADATVEATPAGGRASLGATPLPCELDRVLRTSCQGCHAADPGHAAPMALVTREDLMAPARSQPSRAVYELVRERIHDHAAPMPPASSRALTSEELAAVDAALVAPPPLEAEACDAGAAAEPELPAPAPDEIGECHTFRAHERAIPGDEELYQAPTGEYYSCFYFEVPWEDGSQALTIRSLDTPLTHHWLLYDVTEEHSEAQIVREQGSCGFTPRDVLGAWARGRQDEQRMPPDVGLALPSREAGHALMLEVHYFNGGATAADDTGVEVCTAREPRPQTATISVLGPPVFLLPPGQATTVEGSCTPQYTGDIHIFRAFPHMHERGVAVESQILRADGTRDPVFDIPFDHNNQQMYDVEAVLRPGDQLLTTCHYVNDTDHTVASGYASTEEMCSNFVYAWPAGALQGGFLPGVATACIL